MCDHHEPGTVNVPRCPCPYRAVFQSCGSLLGVRKNGRRRGACAGCVLGWGLDSWAGLGGGLSSRKVQVDLSISPVLSLEVVSRVIVGTIDGVCRQKRIPGV